MFCSIWKKPRSSLLFLRTFLNLADFSEVNVFEEKDISPEQERASELEYEGILKLTRRVLSTSDIESFHSRDFKFAINYWTSVRGHSQLLKRFHGGVPQYALDLFRILLKSGDASFVRAAIKDEVNDMGGVFFLLEHLHLAYFKPHSQQLGLSKKIINVNDTEKLLEALEIVSLLLKSLIGKTRKKNVSEVNAFEKKDVSPEQERASELEYEGILKLTRRVLNTSNVESFRSHDFKLAIEYWTSVRGHSQLLKRFHGGVPQYALDLFRILLKSGDASFVREAIKDEVNDMGGIFFLLEHLHLAYFKPHNQQLGLSKKIINVNDTEKLLEALEIVSLLLKSLIGKTTKRNDNIDYDIALLYLWYKRAWFLNEFASTTSLTATQIENAFDGAITVESCLANMSPIGENLITINTIDKEQLHNIYTILIRSWAQSSETTALGKALGYLNTMENDSRLGNHIANQIPYNSILNLCAQKKDDTTALEIWDRILAPESRVVPNSVTLGTLLLTLVTANQLNKAVTILNKSERGSKGLLLTNTTCYNIVLDGLAKTGSQGADKDAILFLQTMNELSETGANPNVSPDRVTYGIVLSILSKRGIPAEQIENILLDCHSRSINNKGIEPDWIMYNVVLNAYATQSSKNKDAAKRAESLLRIMEKNPKIHPETVCYNSVLHAYAASKDHSLEKIFALFEEMKVKSKAGNEAFHLAAKRAESLLRIMEKNPKIHPETVCYNSVLHAYAASKDHSLEKIFALFEEMKVKSKAGNKRVSPDAFTLNTILNALVKDATEESIERARIFFQEFQELGVETDIVSFNTILKSMVKYGKMKGAESLLRKVEYDYNSGLSEIKPDGLSYNILLDGYAKIATRDAFKNAQKTMKKMETLALSNSDRADCMPDIISYTSVIDSYARTEFVDEGAGYVAEKILNDMIEAGISPNLICYNSVIN
eukprot:CAMPEP_0194194746 /NCGR_PEP_ID=MMETSP0154-20130528/75751_1 /TAXON_ID=1049557 /ORGANISM="Thalassiothrix antarctica, Strain L6-D1" /LENGTH=941 /DNA_ID=CAMNT_0038919203 /DNA_START=1 /DNA_END=2824 /DNA_ORIENTATION=+